MSFKTVYRVEEMIISIALVALLLISVFVAARVASRVHGITESLHPVRKKLSSIEAGVAKEVFGQYEDILFKSKDGLTLHGWYVPSRSGASVIFVHGGGGNRASFFDEAKELVRRGIGVLLFDSRACGESDGAIQSWGYYEQQDLIGALDYLSARKDVDPKRIGVLGFSIGSTTATLVAARDLRVHAIVLNALWTSLEDELYYKSSFPKWLSVWLIKREFEDEGVRIDAVRPINAIKLISPRRLVLVQGDQDLDTPMFVANSVFKSAGSGKEYWVIHGAGHGEYVNMGGSEYVRKLGDFFEQSL